jgi:copper chaperone CopZ
MINNQLINHIIMSEKTLQIKGMSCGHCSARVEKALNAIDGVTATVDLEANSAKVTLLKEVSDETLKAAVDKVGYEVVEIK